MRPLGSPEVEQTGLEQWGTGFGPQMAGSGYLRTGSASRETGSGRAPAPADLWAALGTDLQPKATDCAAAVPVAAGAEAVAADAPVVAA